MKPSVYRAYDSSGALLYVGASVNLLTRINDHSLRARWGAVDTVTYAEHDTLECALACEAEAIVAELPLWNVRGKPKPKLGLVPGE